MRDRKLVKSGGQRVELSVALSTGGFIRSEDGIYVGPSVIYRFRWHTRYRYTDIDTSLVGARQSAAIPFLILFSLFLCVYSILLLDLSPPSLSFPIYLSLSLFPPALLYLFEVRLDLPEDTCGVDLVNTTSSIVKAKSSASSGFSTGNSSSPWNYIEKRGFTSVYVGARIFNSAKVLAFNERTFATTFSRHR